MDASDLTSRFAAAQDLARDAGRYAHDRFGGRQELDVRRKGPQDIVTAVDLEVEDLLRQRIGALFPDDAILGEEQGGSAAERLWVIDPIDGTACFAAGLPYWCVSIAFVDESGIAIGVVFDPNHDELFAARRGNGATLNGGAVTASSATSLTDGAIGLGYSPRVHHHLVTEAMDRLLTAGGMFIRNGSGALMISHVACGRLIGYYEPHINSWDCLAAVLLVHEAGGWTNDFLADDGLMSGNPIVAAGSKLAAEMCRVAGMDGPS